MKARIYSSNLLRLTTAVRLSESLAAWAILFPPTARVSSSRLKARESSGPKATKAGKASSPTCRRGAATPHPARQTSSATVAGARLRRWHDLLCKTSRTSPSENNWHNHLLSRVRAIRKELTSYHIS